MGFVGISDHTPIVQSKFKGLYSRGKGETVPVNYFSDCLNNKFGTEAVSSRDGLHSTPALTGTNIKRFFQYKRLGETARFIWLDNNGNLYDSLYYPAAIYQDATFTDFSGVNFLNRFYISPHNRVEGIPGKSLLVYEGSGTARLAAGSAPTGYTLLATNSAVAGKCEAGIHLIAVANVSTTGFITAPGDSVAEVTCTGGLKISVASIPVGGAEVASKVLLATKSIPASLYTGNVFGYEFFFVPGVSLTAADEEEDISFYDTDLVTSADYLFDNLATIPAGVAVFVYNGRLGVLGADGYEYTAAISEKFDPETINSIDGWITVDPSEGGSGLKNAFAHRKSLIFTSSDRLYATADNDNAPSTWPTPTIIDETVGAEPYAVATILDARGLNSDRAFIASRAGLVCFEGYVKKPELSFNIEDVWARINKAYFNLVQLVDDPVNHRFMVAVPLDAATAISHILYADYSEAFTVYNTLDERAIKWSIWTFPTAPTCFIGDKDATTLESVVHFALTAGNIYTMKDGLTSDFANAFESYWKSSSLESASGWVNHFGGVLFRCTGSCVMQIKIYGEDDTDEVTLPTMTITASPGKDYFRLMNKLSERMYIKFRTNLIDETYTFNRVDVFSKPVYMRRAG